MARRSFDAGGFLLRWLVALVLVFGTFNPTPYSYYHWVLDTANGRLPLKVLAGVAMVILYVIFLRATMRSIGLVGLGLAAALMAALIWVLIDFDLLSLTETRVLTYIILFVMATILAIGVSWSHIRRRITGQSDTDDVDE